MGDDDKLREIRHAWNLSTGSPEARMVISGLSRIGSLEALDMAIALLDDPELKKEAEAAVARIAERTGWGYPAKTAERLNSVLEKIDNEEVKQIIHRILERIE